MLGVETELLLTQPSQTAVRPASQHMCSDITSNGDVGLPRQALH